MNIEEMKIEIMEAMDKAVVEGNGNATVAAAFYSQAIAKMMFYQLFNEIYEFEEPYESEIVEETNVDTSQE